ncbi:MAG: LuxR C-terminal-related transcriptional regulator [Gammaproteobacteria bacterium]|jgi:DNA-binding CsgD family transcriptional regulator
MNTLLSVFEQSTDAVFGIDQTGRIHFVNNAFEQLMGYQRDHLCGVRCAEVLCGIDLHGRQFCGPHCPVPKTVNGQPEIRDFDLVVSQSDGNSVLVNIGVSYTPPQLRQNNGGVDVFFNMRQVNPTRMLQRMALPCTHGPVTGDSNGYSCLTAREKKVLGLAARGMSTRQIASHLFISTQTVRSHFKNIYPKLGVHSRNEAIIYAMRCGLH